MTDSPKQYYPQALDWFEQRDTTLFCDFLGRRPQVINARLDSTKAACSLTDDPGVITPCKLRTLALVKQLRVTLQAIDRYDREIADLASTHPDYALFQPLPGAGPHLTPRLLVAFGEDRERFQSADEGRKYSGIAPVTERSGQKHWVHWRLQCPTFLRQTFIE